MRKPWLISDVARLKALHAEGLPIPVIASKLDRGITAVRNRVKQLKLNRSEKLFDRVFTLTEEDCEKLDTLADLAEIPKTRYIRNLIRKEYSDAVDKGILPKP